MPIYRPFMIAVCVASITTFAATADAAKKKRPRSADAASQPATPASQPAADVSTPAALLGKWMHGSVSPTTYWNSDTGAFVGNARGTAGILEFDAAGRYKEYVYLELRTGNYTNKAWTVHEGTVAFAGDTLTIRPERGHYQFWTNGKQTTDRPMTPDEAKGLTKTYKWTLTKDDAGNDVFTVPFEDGSSFVYRRQPTE